MRKTRFLQKRISKSEKMNRRAFEIPRKQQADNNIDVFYQEYYSEIDANSRPVSPSPASQIYAPNATYSMPRQYHLDTVFNATERFKFFNVELTRIDLKRSKTP
jgi:hypothetical protein